MKNYKFNNFSIVLATFLFAVGGVSIADAVVVIEDANKTGSYFVGKDNPYKGATIKVTTKDSVGTGEEYNGEAIYGIYINRESNGKVNASNNKIEIIGIESKLGAIEAGRSRNKPTSTTKKEASHNSVLITGSTINMDFSDEAKGIWASRIDFDKNTPHDFVGTVNYNTTVLKDNTAIKHTNLRGGISWTDEAIVNYNTLFVQNSTMYANGSTFEITGGFAQEDNDVATTGKTGSASYNQLIYDGVTTYYDKDKKATSERLTGGMGKLGVANNNRIYVRDLNKDANDSVVTIQTDIIGGATWRNNSGGAEGNIAVVVGDSKVANVYGGAVGFDTGGGATTGSSEGANSNLVILDLSNNGIVTENVYGGYISDTTSASTTGNAVYALSGTVKGSIVGGNKDNNNTLILGKDTSSIGTINAGAITGFDSLQFNTLEKDGKAVLNLTGNKGSDLNNTEIKFLQTTLNTDTVQVRVGGENNDTLGIKYRGDGSGGAKAIEALTKNAVSYNAKTLDKISVVTGDGGAKANNDIDENLTREDGSSQANYGIGDTLNYTYDNTTVDLTKPGKYYLIKSNENLENYDKIKIAEPQNEKRKGDKIKYENNQTIELEIVDAYQPDQVYRILDKDTYTRNLRGMFVENNKSLLITGTDSIVEDWSDKEFGDYDSNNDGEFNRFNQPSNTGNKIYIEANAGDLVGKTIYGGYSEKGNVSDNNISIDQNANLSNATIIGGFSQKGKVSGNSIDLNNTSVTADIILAQTDGGSVEVSNDNIKNADGVTINGSVTIAKSTGSANLEKLSYEMPKFAEITGDFTLADTNTGSANENSLTLNNDINVGGNIYTANSVGNANSNTLTLKGNIKAGEIYVAKGANEANENKLIINGEIDSAKVVVAEGKTTNKNIADFNLGKITGTLYGGIGSGKENTLNVKDTQLKAGNVANFNIMNFADITSTKNDNTHAALILTKDEATDLSGVRIDISDNQYNIETNPGYATLDKNSKYYLIHKENSTLTNYDQITNTPMPNPSSTVRNGDIAVGALQTDQIYKIKSSTLYTRNLAGMFVSSDKKDLYITGANEVEETWSDTEFNTDEFTKFKKPDNKDNHIYIEANAGDLGGKTIYGGYSDNDDTSNNNIYLNKNANLSNATIIGGYSKSGTVSNNNIDLNNTDIKADITLAQTDNGSIDIATNKLNNANNQKITGSLTVAKSDSTNLENATYTMPENITITGDFILANSNSGNTSNNTLDITNATATNIYVGKTNSGEASNNTINIKGDKVEGNIYVGHSQSGNTNNNIANFEKGEVTGTIYGGNNGTTGNTLNVKDTKLKAGNVANFNIMNFADITSTKNDNTHAALILTKDEATDLSGARIDISDNQYNIETNPGYATLDKNSKYYLIHKENNKLQNYKQITNTPMPMPNQGNTVGNGDIAVGALQTDQVYKIKSSALYTRNLAGMFVSSDKKDLYITGANEVEENWSNSDNEFNSNEFIKFGKPDNKDNHIFIEASVGDLGGKTIYGGYSDNNDTSNNNIYINQGANLSNATIIGGYSKSGKVSSNNIDLNKTDIKADIILASTDNGSVEISNDNIKNADSVTIDGSVIIAQSKGSANLNALSYEMPKFKEITKEFILADTSTGSGTANENTLTLNNDIKVGEIYVAKGADEANKNTLEINGGKIDSSKVIVGSAKSANDNIANFNSGEITGTLVGGNIGGTGNTLNVNSTMLKAGNVANFQVMNFKQSYLGSTTSETNAALILTGADNLDFSGVEVQIGDEKYNPKTDYGLGENQKFYLVSSAAIEENYNSEFLNYKNSSLRDGVKGNEITHWDDSKGYVIDALQTSTKYIIDNPNTFTRDIRGMFVADDTKALYLTGNSKIKETIGDTIGGSDFFTKFGGPGTDNTITIAPKDPNKPFDLGDVTLDGGPSGNTLNIGKDSSNTIEMDKITVKDVQNFENINFYLPKNPGVGTTAVKLSDGSNTDLSNSNVMIYVDNLDDLEKQGGRVHLFDGNNELANNKPKSANYQIGSILMIDVTNSLDLSVDKTTPITPTDQTKIFNEARLGGLGALWQGQYLIANHLDRIIPDAFSELFPYAIVEGYDKRFNTGSHVDTVGFNANAGFASKGTNSSGEFTMGPFIEYGTANYDAYLDDGTHGDGKNYYIGGGFFGKQENNSGSYFEATFRIGKLITEFDGDLTFNKVRKHYDFDLKSTYIAAHAGLGKVFDLNANNDLDLYARYFYTHIEASEIKIDGIDTKFDAVQSNKIRLGAKHDYKLNENHKFYAGAAWEYEFDAKAGGRYLIAGGNTGEMKKPSLRGSTGIGEIGYQYKKDETLKFDVGVKGYVGKQEGVSAQMAISIAF